MSALQTTPPALILSSNAAVFGAVAAGPGPAHLSGLAVRDEVSRGALVEVPTELDLSRRCGRSGGATDASSAPVAELVRLAVKPR